MANKQRIPLALQQEMIEVVSSTFSFLKDQSQPYRTRMTDVFEAYDTYKDSKTAGGKIQFIINKASEAVEKWLPRIIAKNPRFILSRNTDSFGVGDFDKRKNELKERLENGEIEFEEAEMELLKIQTEEREFTSEMANQAQAYLTYLFDEYDLRDKIRHWAKNMLVYGTAIAKVEYKYDVEKQRNRAGNVVEKIVGEYPTLKVTPWKDIYLDARYKEIKDMPGIIELRESVRLSELRKNKSYFNLDKIEKISAVTNEDGNMSDDTYNERIKTILGINVPPVKNRINKNNFEVLCYYGYFEVDGKEDMYKITIVNNQVVIGFEEILDIPFVALHCFENPEGFYGTGLVERIMSLQDELNFKKQAYADAVNLSLFRSFAIDDALGVPPEKLNLNTGGKIIKVKNVQALRDHIYEFDFKPLPAEYFNEQNDLERQIDSGTFLVNPNTPRSSSALTDTATGARISAFDANSVIQLVADNTMSAISKVGYKLLKTTFENLKSNLVIKKQGSSEFWDINKESMRDAITRYSIKIEANSSAFDDADKRRENGIALLNQMTQLLQLGVVDADAVKKIARGLLDTYERLDVDDILGSSKQEEQGTPEAAAKPQDVPEVPDTEDRAANLTAQVAGGQEELTQ